MRIVIVLEGCLVQGVFADAPGCQYAVIDLDTGGADRHRLCLTPQGRECAVSTDEAVCDPTYVDQIFHRQQTGGVPAGLVVEMAGALANVVASHDNWHHCSDPREALSVWSETVDKVRRILGRVTGAASEQEETDNG